MSEAEGRGRLREAPAGRGRMRKTKAKATEEAARTVVDVRWRELRTYGVRTECSNCGERAEHNVPLGIPLSEWPCLYCSCRTLRVTERTGQ